MNKEKEMRRLVWKFFLKRKWQDIKIFCRKWWLMILFLLWVAVVFIGQFFGDGSTMYTISRWTFYIGAVGLLTFLIGSLLFLIGREMIRSIRKNWEWAHSDADKELKRSRQSRPLSNTKIKMKGG